MKNTLSLLFVFSLLVSGCDLVSGTADDSEGKLSITTDQRVYSTERVVARFENDRTETILYDQCGAVLYRGSPEGSLTEEQPVHTL